MIIENYKYPSDINDFLAKIILNQSGYELELDRILRKRNGVFLTNSLQTIENVLSIIEIDDDIFNKRILEPSCGQGIFLLKLISDVYNQFPNSNLITEFISNSLFFVDIQEEMVKKTIDNIKVLYRFLFDSQFTGKFNAIAWDFTDKITNIDIFSIHRETPFSNLYRSFDYVIGNPPYVTLYGRRDKKQNEEQRVNYLTNYDQFPPSVKNGKLNLVMLFIEHSLDFLKENGKLSFIIDVSFFETAYKYTRKYILEKTKIEELHVNIKDFDVASGQVVIKFIKSIENKNNNVRITDHKTKSNYLIPQLTWLKKDDEYKFRYNGCSISKKIIEKIVSKQDKTLLELFPKKNLRTCVMLLDMEEQFTFQDCTGKDKNLLYPYYQGSKSLLEKFGELKFKKYFFYNKPLQDTINNELKIQLEKEGVKNKKRLGLGETIVYDNPKIYIRQSAKEIIATIDMTRSSANNSLYVFSLRNNDVETIDFLYFLCGWLNSDLITYFSQQMNIVRYSQGKQPQIKIADLGTLFIPSDKTIQITISNLVRKIYVTPNVKAGLINEINSIVYDYYSLTTIEQNNLTESIKSY